jgi:hypothetical protein
MADGLWLILDLAISHRKSNAENTIAVDLVATNRNPAHKPPTCSRGGLFLMKIANATRPATSEYAPHYETYIKLVSETNVVDVMRKEGEATQAFLRGVPETEAAKRHAPYTWTVKQVVGHITDAERIFGTRALRFARHDTTSLPGFEENSYVDNAHFDDRTLADIARELEFLRLSHLHLFRSFHEQDWSRSGVASDARITVRALAYAIVGHERHHMTILRKRLAGTAGS